MAPFSFFFLICSHCSEEVIRKIIQNMYLYFSNILFQHSCSHTSMGDTMLFEDLLFAFKVWGLIAGLIPELLPKERLYTFVWQLLCSNIFQCFLLP